jgi:hypothetical protein
MVNLCDSCKKQVECFEKGITERSKCAEYDPLPPQEQLEKEDFVRGIMVGPCPNCGSDNTCDCENDPLFEDICVGHCLHCGTYWCLECGFVFGKVKEYMECPHWQICEVCSEENSYLSDDEFMERICPTCEHYKDGCTLEDPSACEKEDQFMCPYDGDISECPKIQDLVRRDKSKKEGR